MWNHYPGLLLLTAASIRDIRKREIARWMLPAAGLLSLGSVLKTAVLAAQEIAAPETDAAACVMSVLCALLPGAALLGLAFLSRESIGYGDGLLALCIGPLFGWEHMAGAICLAFFLSAMVSVALLAAKRADRSTQLPFVPFLTAAMGVMCVVLR
ncbi:MAG: A24 family peptidase [Lachnospiraceae bacterium]|nr:A24 family peptidase [Lachnospiraceae bacterium]